MRYYLKAIIASVDAGLIAASALWPFNPWITVSIAVVGALGVYLVPNTTPGGKSS